MSLVIGSRDMRVDGRTVVLEAAPALAKRRTAYVPLSVFSLGLGARVSWDANHTIVRISKGAFEVSLSVSGGGVGGVFGGAGLFGGASGGSGAGKIGGAFAGSRADAGRSGEAKLGRLGTPALLFIVNKEGLPLVPVRAVAEALNCTVDFVKAEKRVMILER